MQNVIVKLAGREYEIKPLPIRPAREIRQRLTEPLIQVIEMLRNAPAKTDLSDAQGIGELLGSVKTILVGSIDLCLDLLFSYSPELKADQEYIENNAYDDEALKAVLEVLKLLYPFGGLVKKLAGLVSGLAALGTSTNSRSANGDAGQTSSTK